ncbi:MAG: hypothetical protein HYY16_01885 [Planctomycetes bacterium]|nr:hypothetical protein [Planctomycetota bacterium]
MPATILTILFGLAWGQQEEPAPAPAPQEEAAKPWLDEFLGVPTHGFLTVRYRFRAANDDNARDNDLYEYLSADIGQADRHRITGHLFVRATEDLDGETNESGFFAFDNITDSYDSALNARLYTAHLDVRRLGPLEDVRLGRQFLEETPLTFHFDGVLVESEALKGLRELQAGVYGGLPVHLYESSTDGDAIVGTYLKAEPWSGAHARFDYTRVIDEYLFGTERNDLFGLGLTQRCGERFLIGGQYNVLEGEPHDILGRTTFFHPELDLQVQLTAYRLFETQRALAIDVDSFFTAAREYFPFWQTRLLVSKGFGKHFSLQGGVDVRELRRDGDEAPLNREFRRYYLTPTVMDWPWPRFTAGVTFEAWQVPGTDNGDIQTAGFDVGYKASDALKLSAGTSFAVYKFDVLADAERENVRTVYARAVASLSAALKADLLVEFEDADIDEFWTVKVGVTQSF